jgi:transcriptional regulator with XRE-family HTH domain
MAKTIAPLLPPTTELLRGFGDRLRLARRRRRLTAKQVAERAGMAPMTLRSLERGRSGVTMGAYLSVMQVLGIERDLDLLAAHDPLGRELQDAQLPVRGKSPVRALPPVSAIPVPDQRSVPIAASVATPVANPAAHQPAGPIKQQAKSGKTAQRWVEKSGFASSQTLVDLIDPTGPSSKKRR